MAWHGDMLLPTTAVWWALIDIVLEEERSPQTDIALAEAGSSCMSTPVLVGKIVSLISSLASIPVSRRHNTPRGWFMVSQLLTHLPTCLLSTCRSRILR